MPGECPVCNAWDSRSWCRLPKGLEDVSKYPDLIAELLRRSWTETEVRGVLSENLLRVFSEVEKLVRERGHLGFLPFAHAGRLANLGLSPGKQYHASSRGRAYSTE